MKLYIYTFFDNFIKKDLLNLANTLFSELRIIQSGKKTELFSAC